MNGIRLLEVGRNSDLLKKYCRDIGVPVEAFRELIEIELRHAGKGRRHGINDDFLEVIDRILDGDEKNVPA